METNYETKQINNFYGKEVINHSMYLLPSLPNTSTIKLGKPHGCISCVDCNLIIVDGNYTKTINNNEEEVICEEIPFKVLIEDPRICDLDKRKYSVEHIEVKKICCKFTCLNTETNKYYKLKESDLITVRVSYNQCIAISWTQTVTIID